MEMSRCMLYEKDLPKKFWAEAANTAVFVQNRLPTKTLQGKTPFEAWYGYKPLLTNLKVFGCICYTLVPQVKRDKLDKRADTGIFIGYSSVSKAYKVFQPQSGKIVISRDIEFAELEKWHWEEKRSIPDSRSSSTTPPLDETIDDIPVRGTRSLFDVYQRCNVSLVEPKHFGDAVKDPKWIDAMQEELNMIDKNQTWVLVDRPEYKKVIGVKWVFKTKLNANGSINKYKARLVVKGYAQVYGEDFTDTFAPVARLDTIRLILAIAAQKGWAVWQLDVKSAFLNGYLEEEIFVEQPEGFVAQGQEEKVYLLKKALYGLKQAPRAWYSRIDEHLQSLGFTRSLNESTLYIKHSHADLLIISLYVDDLLVTGSNVEQVDLFKQEMQKVFEMTDLGTMSYFLGMEIKQDQQGIFINQKKYAREILNRFSMEGCKAIATPMNQKEKLSKNDAAEKADEGIYRSLVGCLMYLTATRPDILYAVSVLSRFLHCATVDHYKAAKRVLRYIKGTLDYGIQYKHNQVLKLEGCSDSDWGGSLDDMKSTSGYCFTLSSGVFSWSSKKQEVVAQSTAEAEFIAANATVKQALWLRKLLTDLQFMQQGSTPIYVDNQAAIAISKNPVFHGKTKHFNIKLYFIREVQQSGEVTLIYCRTSDQVADIFTKALPRDKFEELRMKLGMCSY